MAEEIGAATLAVVAGPAATTHGVVDTDTATTMAWATQAVVGCVHEFAFQV